MKMTFYKSDVLAYFVVTESSAIIVMTTAFHELPSDIHDGIFSTVADVVTRTPASHALPSYDYNSLTSYN